MNLSEQATCPVLNNTRQLKLTRGYFATVPESEYERILEGGPWRSEVCRRRDGSIRTVYAVRDIYSGRHINSKIRSLHRFIFNLTDPKVQVDHDDGDGLNCTIENMRVTDHINNSHNTRRPITNTSGYKGVTRDKRHGTLQVSIDVEGVRYSVGFDPDELIVAARCYDYMAVKFYGEFACTNVKMGLLTPISSEEASRFESVFEPRVKPDGERLYRTNKSGYLGVYWDKVTQRWRVRIMINKYHNNLGFFALEDLIPAARCYDAAAIKYRGKDAVTNVSLGLLPPLDNLTDNPSA